MNHIDNLASIINGINSDGTLNTEEKVCLQNWVNKNRNLVYEKEQAAIISLVDSVLKAQKISAAEREQILKYVNRHLGGKTDEIKKL